MTEKDVVLAVMNEVGVNRSELSSKAGYSSKSAVTEILNRTGMKVGILLKLLNAMDCELIVRHNDKEWVIGKLSETQVSPSTETDKNVTSPSVDLDSLLSDDESAPPQKKIKLK